MKRVTLIINGKKIKTEDNISLLEVARNNNIFIPTLCYLKDSLNCGKCGLCFAEVIDNGSKEILRSCFTMPKDGMVVNTNTDLVRNLVKSRLVEILNEHDFRCPQCERRFNCELIKLAFKYSVMPEKVYDLQYKGSLDYYDDRSKSIVINRNKCIKCGRCEAACATKTTTNSINLEPLGNELRVQANNNKCLDETNCLLCGQCVIACPVNALSEKSHIDRVKEALKNPKKHVIAAIAPSVRASIGELFGMVYGVDVTGKLYRALRELGFDKVFDLNFGADLTIVEEASELVKKIKNNGPFPMFTSCCPAWIREAENYFQELLSNISTTKSPQQIFGAASKTYYPKAMNIDAKDVYTVTIMPCVAKKFECDREGMDVNGIKTIDAVLTAREFFQMVIDSQIQFEKLEDDVADPIMGEYSGAGAIFGVTGGVMEAAIRTAKDWLENADLKNIDYKAVRGFENIKEATVNIDNKEYNVAVINGSKNVFDFINSGMLNKKQYHFIEVMACTGGCINGGGHPHVNSLDREKVDYRGLRGSVLYAQDHRLPNRKSHENSAIIKMYDNYIGTPGNEFAHEIFHVKY